MADLDDFFAKRDKKKSKTKKFDNTDDFAKALEQKAKEKKKMETGKSNYAQESGRTSPGPGLPAGGDDEWLEAVEKEPDYTGLKIQELVLSDDDDVDSKSQDGRASGDEAGNEGPWNKKTKSKKSKEEEPKEESETIVTEEKEKSEDTNAEDGEGEESSKTEEKEDTEDKKYVPPYQRKLPETAPAGSASSTQGAYVPPSRRGPAAGGPPLAPLSSKKKGTAPTLEDENSFPTLS